MKKKFRRNRNKREKENTLLDDSLNNSNDSLDNSNSRKIGNLNSKNKRVRIN
jgi:hypothetical protein